MNRMEDKSRRAGMRIVATVAALALGASACGTTRGPTMAIGTAVQAANNVPWIEGGSPWGTSWSYNPYSGSYFGSINNWVLLPLAIGNSSYPPTYDRLLAQSWHLTTDTITIGIRKGARWQNGQPVTARDVLDSLVLDGVDGYSVWDELTSARVAGPKTLDFGIRKGVPPASVLESILLNTYPIPAAQYGRFIGPTTEPNLLTYSSPTVGQSTKAALGTQIGNLLKKVESYSPRVAIGDGPFRVTRITSQTAIFSKWRGFWAARSIHVPQIGFEAFGSNSEVAAALLGHRIAWSNLGTNWAINSRLKEAPDMGYYTVNSGAMAFVLINCRRPWLNNVKVRQALAYIIRRPLLLDEQNGGHRDVPVSIPTALSQRVLPKWIPQGVMAHLNPYRYSPTTAARLLRGAGFRRVAGKWITPAGTPFTLTGLEPSGFGVGPFVTGLVGQLRAFGITASGSSVSVAEWGPDIQSGNFDLAYQFVAPSTANPLAEIDAALAGDDFSSPSSPGIGLGPVAMVPGIGRVNIPETLGQEETSVGPGTQMRQLTSDWAKFINSTVPFIQYEYQREALQFVLSQYHDYPPPSSNWWKYVSVNLEGGLLGVMVAGYIRPTRIK